MSKQEPTKNYQLIQLTTIADEQDTILKFFDNQAYLLGVKINDMFFDGLYVYNLANDIKIEQDFDAKPVYDFLAKSFKISQFSDLLTRFSQQKDFIAVLNVAGQQGLFVGIESLYQGESVMDIGYITQVSANQILLKCVNTDGSVENNPYPIEIEDIIRLEIGSKYLKTYQEFINRAT